MDRWKRWSLLAAGLWGLALAGVSLLLGLITNIDAFHAPTLDETASWIHTLFDGAMIFVLIAALRNWIFRRSITPESETQQTEK
jgi:hypothetical protein